MSEAKQRNHRASESAEPAIGQVSSEVAAPLASEPASAAKHLVDVDAVLFRAASEVRSFEEVRYYLNGVYVHPHPIKGVLLVGTDGHRMMVVHDESGSCSAPAIVEAAPKALSGVKIPSKATEPRQRLVVAEDKPLIVGTYRSLGPAIIDGTFPNYILVLKPVLEAIRKGQFHPASFNSEYFVSFGKVAQILKSGTHAMRMVCTSESDAALILFGGASEALGILMPMRTTLNNGFPSWMQPVLEPPPVPEKSTGKRRAKREVTAKAKRPAKRGKPAARKKRVSR